MPTTRIPYGVLDGRYVNTAGDTMLGELTLAGAPTLDLHAATKKYVDDAVGVGGHTHTLSAGATDVTATAAEVNLLDLSGLSIGQVLRATGAASAAWGGIQAGDLPTGIDAAKVSDGSVSNTEYQYLNGVTSAIQTQLDAKAADSVVLKKDGSVALTSDWDIGGTRRIWADGIRARDAAGLELYDDGGNGILIEDGGEVGIGTNSPDRKLEVLDASSPQLRLAYTDGSVYTDFQTISDGYLYINSSGGRIGIELSSPQTTLEVYAPSTHGFRMSSPDSGLLGYAIAFGSSRPPWVNVNAPNARIDTAGNFVFNAGNSGDLYFGFDTKNLPRTNYFDGVNRFNYWNTNQVSIFESKVGIGTTGPDRRLDVLDATNPQLRLTHTDGSVYTDFQTVSDGYLHINPSGNRVGIGTSSPSQALEVAGSVIVGAHDTYHKLYVNRYSSGGYAYIVAGDTDRDMGVGFAFQYRNDNGSLVTGLSIDVNGKVGIGITPSARRLEILDSSASQFRLTQLANTNYVDFLANASGNLTITPSGSRVLMAKALEVDGAFDHDGSTFGVFGVTPASRVPAYTVTNAITDRSFDADNTTIAELADVVATIINDMKTYGFFQ